MDITGQAAREELLQWAIKVENVVRPRSASAAEIVASARQTAENDRFLITVLGKAKRGKSTLINALLGRQDDELAPVDKLPASNVVSRFRYAEELSCRVYFRGAQLQSTDGQTISISQIRNYVTEEGNPGNHKQVELVEITGPFEGFSRDLVLIDTPGSGSIHEYHDALLQVFLPQSDAVIFLVTASMPLDQGELDLLRRVRDADIGKILFVINKVDASSSEELAEAESHNLAHLSQLNLNQPMGRLIPLSAKRALLGEQEGSGLPVLAAEVRRLITQDKSSVQRERLISRVKQAVEPILPGLAAELALSTSNPEERVRQKVSLEQALERLEVERPVTEATFRARWQNALDEFAAEVRRSSSQIQQRVVEFIDCKAIAAIGEISRELPEQIQTLIGDVLQPPAAKLETSLRQAADALKSDYPRVSLESGGIVITRSCSSGTLALGFGGAAAIGATGAGLITAAQAASAAAVNYVVAPNLIGAGLTYLIGTHAGFLTTTTVPTAIPFWVAATGPIGWTLAGLGVLAVPFAWTVSRSKQKNQLRTKAVEQVEMVLDTLLEERIPLLIRSGETIIAEFRQRSLNETLELRQALTATEQMPHSQADIDELVAVSQQLERLLTTIPGGVA